MTPPLQDRRTLFMNGSRRGDGGDGNTPDDAYLAAAFKVALNRAKGSSTMNPHGRLTQSVDDIVTRVEQAGHYTLVSNSLMPIAKRIMDIKGYSDKRNPIILQTHFEDFDLSVNPSFLEGPQ